MEQLTYGLIHPNDIAILQQMIQDTEFSCMCFNRQSSPIYIARSHFGIVGFALGHKGYGEQSHVLTIQGTYFYHRYDDLQHQNELQLEFMNWAKKNLGVTHYKLGEFAAVQPVGIAHIIPPQTFETPAVEACSVGQLEHGAPAQEYAFS